MQPTALKLAGLAMRYLERKQAVTANNLANVNASGFKRERVFANLLADQSVQPNSITDMRAGSLNATGNPLDIAIDGAGMFVVRVDGSERYSRSGSLRLDPQSRLVDQNGNAVLGDHGEIVLPPGEARIDGDGNVTVNGDVIDRLRIERFNQNELKHESGTIFRADGAGVPVPDAERSVLAGQLEASNVSTLDALVEMIEVQRAYAAMQSSMRSIDDVMRTASNDIGRI